MNTTASGCKATNFRLVIEPEVLQAEKLSSVARAVHTAMEYGPFGAEDYLPAIEMLASLMNTHAIRLDAIFEQWQEEAAK